MAVKRSGSAITSEASSERPMGVGQYCPLFPADDLRRILAELEIRGWLTERPNKAPEPTTMAVTIRAPSSTDRASHGRGSSLTLGLHAREKFCFGNEGAKGLRRLVGSIRKIAR